MNLSEKSAEFWDVEHVCLFCKAKRWTTKPAADPMKCYACGQTGGAFASRHNLVRARSHDIYASQLASMRLPLVVRYSLRVYCTSGGPQNIRTRWRLAYRMARNRVRTEQENLALHGSVGRILERLRVES